MAYWLFTMFSAAALVGVDQLLKYWAVTVLQPVGEMPLIPHIVSLRFVLNDGAAFGMLAGKQGFLLAVTGVALAGVLVYLLAKKAAGKLEYAAWLLVFAGGMGNLVDRVMNGAVVDYLNLLFMRFAVFNFADILVCTGIGLLCLAWLLPELKKGGKKRDAEL